ncbi:secreted protein [Rhodopirellula maiorica SM1]|uniref:Secreted protein n=2 Tax=Novipirellula TaxID=2795426 RepID=M5RMF3_9BACT|nr:secreted protein [Rhodopirellula maiorica SM1]
MSWSSSSKIFFLLIFLLSTGCGGGGTPTSVAEDDEIAQYLSENPEAAETDLDVDVNVENDE